MQRQSFSSMLQADTTGYTSASRSAWPSSTAVTAAQQARYAGNTVGSTAAAQVAVGDSSSVSSSTAWDARVHQLMSQQIASRLRATSQQFTELSDWARNRLTRTEAELHIKGNLLQQLYDQGVLMREEYEILLRTAILSHDERS
jgi:hypothetical protein